jgi:hypothetical protein
VGFIRKTLFLTTGGIVAPNSTKQRRQEQILAAVQGGNEGEIRWAGSRNAAFGARWTPPEPARQEDPEGREGRISHAADVAARRARDAAVNRGLSEADAQRASERARAARLGMQ